MADKQIRVIVDIDTSGKGDAKVKASLGNIEREVDRINKQTAKSSAETDRAIERSKKALADSQIRENKRVQNDFIRSIEQMRKESERAANQTKSTFSDTLKGSFFGTLGANAVAFFTNQLAQLPSKVGDILDEATKIAQDRLNAFKGLESTAIFKGFDPKQAQEVASGLRLVKAGIIDLTDAAAGEKSLLQFGFTVEQSRNLLERFSDSAAFGKQSALTYGQAVSRTAEGVKQFNSNLADAGGMTTNLSIIMDRAGVKQEDFANKRTAAAAIEKYYNSLMQETAGTVGDADKLTQGYTGSTAALDQAYQNLLAAGGELIIQNPKMVESNKILTEQINAYTAGVKDADSETGKFAANAVNEYAKMKASGLNLAASFINAFKLLVNSIASGVSAWIGGLAAIVEYTAATIANVAVRIMNSFADATDFILDTAAKIPGMSETVASVPRPKRVEYVGTPVSDFFFKAMRDFNEAAEKNTQTLRSLDKEYSSILNRMSVAGLKTATSPFDLATIKGDTASTTTTKANTKAVTDLTNTIKGGGTGKAKAPTGGEKEMRRFFEDRGFNVNRTFGREINKGSLHPSGRAADVAHQGHTTTEIGELVAAAIEKGYRFFEERQKRPGVKQTAPHLHFEINPRKPSSFLGQEFYGNVPLAYLKQLDAKRLGKSTVTADEISRFNQQESDQKTKAEQEKNIRAALDLYKRFGLIPSGEVLNKFRALMVEDAKKAGAVQPSDSDVAKIFADNFRSAGTGFPMATVSGISENRLTPNQEWLNGLRESLGISEDITELAFRRMNIEAEIALNFKSRQLQQDLEILDITRELSILNRQNADDQFTEQRRLLAAKREEYELQQEITKLQDELYNGSVNNSLKIQAAYLRDILDLRNRELDAIISINRSQLELSQSMEVSNNQIRARVLEHLASQKTLNESIADGIINIYDKAANKLDSLLDKAGIGKVPIIGDIAKNLARNQLTNLTRGLLDKFLPPEISEQLNKTGNPVLDEARTQTGLLKQIVANTGGVSNALGVRPRVVGGLDSIISGINGGSLSGQQSGGFGSILRMFGLGGGGMPAHEGTHAGQSGSRFGGLGAGIGMLATMAGGAIGGRIGRVLSGAGTGAQIGSMFGPWGTAIGAGVGALFGLFGGGDKSLKYLKSASQSEFGVDVKDKKILATLKGYGGGSVPDLASAIQTVNLPPSVDLLRAYAEMTGQNTRKFDLKDLGSETNPLNQFRGKFAGYREFGGAVRAGYSYVIGERRPEVFTPSVNGYVSPSISANNNGAEIKILQAAVNQLTSMVGALLKTNDNLNRKLASMSPQDVLAIAAKNSPEIIGDAVDYEFSNNPKRISNLRTNLGDKI